MTFKKINFKFKNPYLFIAALIIILSFILQFILIPNNYWNDDFVRIEFSRGTIIDILKGYINYNYQVSPVYLILLNIATRFGLNNYYLLNIFINLITLIFVAKFYPKIMGKKATIFYLLLVSFSYPIIFFSQTISSYTLVILLCTICNYLLFFKFNKKNILILIILLLLLFHTHSLTIFYCFFVLMYISYKTKSIRNAAISLFSLLLLLFTRYHLLTNKSGLNWIPKPSLNNILKDLVKIFFFNLSPNPIFLIIILSILSILLYFSRSKHSYLTKEKKKFLPYDKMIIHYLILSSILILFVFSQFKPIYTDRYVLFIAPSLHIIITSFFLIFNKSQQKIIFLFLVTTILLIPVNASLFAYKPPFRERLSEYEGPNSFLLTTCRNETVIIEVYNSQTLPFSHLKSIQNISIIRYDHVSELIEPEFDRLDKYLNNTCIDRKKIIIGEFHIYNYTNCQSENLTFFKNEIINRKKELLC